MNNAPLGLIVLTGFAYVYFISNLSVKDVLDAVYLLLGGSKSDKIKPI